MANVAIGWDSFWPMVKSMPDDGRMAIGRELDGNDFEHWIEGRSVKVQIEVLQAAPVEIQQYFYSKNVISPVAVSKLGIRPGKAQITDRRTIRR